MVIWLTELCLLSLLFTSRGLYIKNDKIIDLDQWQGYEASLLLVKIHNTWLQKKAQVFTFD